MWFHSFPVKKKKNSRTLLSASPGTSKILLCSRNAPACFLNNDQHPSCFALHVFIPLFYITLRIFFCFYIHGFVIILLFAQQHSNINSPAIFMLLWYPSYTIYRSRVSPQNTFLPYPLTNQDVYMWKIIHGIHAVSMLCTLSSPPS